MNNSKQLSEQQKLKDIIKQYTSLMKMKSRVLSEEVYVGIVELCLKNGDLKYGSYFLCQMERLKINIPRRILDMFLDYSINNKVFESKIDNMPEEKPFIRKGFTNKFDEAEQPEFSYYFSHRNQYKNRIDDITKEYKKLKLDAKPYHPKKISNSAISLDPAATVPEKKVILNVNAKSFEPSVEKKNSQSKIVLNKEAKDFVPKSLRNQEEKQEEKEKTDS